MTFDELRDQACASLRAMIPRAGDSSRLVDECLASARRAFRDDFILRLSPEAWARIALGYTTTFLDSGADVGVGEIAAAVLRDSINNGRFDLLAQQVAQAHAAATPAAPGPPSLTVVKP